MVYIEPLPYSLGSPRFAFPAMASLSGSLPLGGGREVVLAVIMAARLANSMTGENPLSAPDRAGRVSGARTWLASLTLPTAVRSPLLKCIESTEGEPAQTAAALRALLTASSNWLDGASVQELEQLIRLLSGRGLS